MIYEFLAVRILARYFGGSLDVWASVIAILLAGLSLGYVVGGITADRCPSWRCLGLFLLIGGITGSFMERITVGAGEFLVTVEKGLAWHPYFAATLSSFVPILALGTVLPQAIKLQTQRIERVGATAGWIAAVSTAGSIAGVVLAVHVLIPYAGVRQGLYATSLVLIGLGGALMLFGRRAHETGSRGYGATCDNRENQK